MKAKEESMTAVYHGVGIGQEVTKHVQEALGLNQLGVDVPNLGHAHRCGLTHVGIGVLR
jgi:hypothetical protein